MVNIPGGVFLLDQHISTVFALNSPAEDSSSHRQSDIYSCVWGGEKWCMGSVDMHGDWRAVVRRFETALGLEGLTLWRPIAAGEE